VVEDPPRARGVSQVIQRRPSAKSATVLAVAPVWRLSDTPAGHGVPIRPPLHREMTTLTRSGSSSTVARRSRRQRHGRKRLEKHGQGCAAGSVHLTGAPRLCGTYAIGGHCHPPSARHFWQLRQRDATCSRQHRESSMSDQPPLGSAPLPCSRCHAPVHFRKSQRRAPK
jgi:hypothetical protein